MCVCANDIRREEMRQTTTIQGDDTRTAAELMAEHQIPYQMMRMALHVLKPNYFQDSTANGVWGGVRKVYPVDEQRRILAWIKSARTVLYGRAEHGTSMEYLGHMRMEGLDGELATYIPQAKAEQDLHVGSHFAVTVACQTWWARVMVERKKDRHAVEYGARPGELVCVRFNTVRHATVWVRQDGLPAFKAHLLEQKPGRPAIVR
jgi:hypothetical protein